MPKDFLRSFTGGVANEIDPQNLRDDQAVTARDIDIKGFALEPGDVADTDNAPGGYYKYRGEWIDDPDARSFEEYGDSVIKTYDNRRPEVEQIKAGANGIKNLGSPKQPATEVTGAIISEGSIGEEEAVGSHVITLDRYPPFKIYKRVNCSFTAATKKIAYTSINHNEINFEVGDKITVSKSASNDGEYTIAEIENDYIKVSATDTLTDEAAVSSRTVFLTRNGSKDSSTDTLDFLKTSGSANPIDGDSVNDWHEYNGDIYWVQENKTTTNGVTTINSLQVYVLNGSGVEVYSSTLTDFSGGRRFKGQYFMCWDQSNVSIITLSTSSFSTSTVSLTADTEFLNASPTSTIHSMELVGNKAVFLQTLVGTVGHPSSYSTDATDWWYRNNTSSKETILVLSSIGNSGDDFSVTQEDEQGKTKVLVSSYTTIGQLKYAHCEVKSKEWVRISTPGSGPPEIRFLTGTGVSISNHRTWDKHLYTKKRVDGAKGTLPFGMGSFWIWGPVTKYRDVYGEMEGFTLTAGNKSISWEWRIGYWQTKWHGGGTTGINNEGHYEYWGRTGAQTDFHKGTNVPGGSRSAPNGWDSYLKAKSNEGTGGDNNVLGSGAIPKTATYEAKLFRGASWTLGSGPTGLPKFSNFGRTYIKLAAARLTGSTMSISGLSSQIQSHLFRKGDALTISNTRWNDGIYTIKSVSTGVLTINEKFTPEDAYATIGSSSSKETTFATSYTPSIIQSQMGSNVLVRTASNKIQMYNSSLNHPDTYGDITYSGSNIDAVDSGTNPRVLYTDSSAGSSSTMYSVRGNLTSTKISKTFDSKVSFRLNDTYIVVVGGGDISAYTPELTHVFQKSGFKANCLGMGAKGDTPTHFIQDGFHYRQSYIDYFVVKRVDGTWMTIKTGDEPRHSMLTAPFSEPLYYSGSKLWGVTKNSDGSASKFESVLPYFSDSFAVNSYIMTEHSSTKIFGKITGVFEDKTEMNKLYFPIQWMNDASLIGLSKDSGKIGDDTALDFEISIDGTPNSGYTAWQNSTTEPKFKSLIDRNIVFFSNKESNIPAAGSVDVISRLTFDLHPRQSEYFLVDSKDNPSIAEKHKTKTAKLKRGSVAHELFDSSEFGISTFRVGAPNMYNPDGPRIDFYYRASFVDGEGQEGPPSDSPDSGISGMDSQDDSIQVLFSKAFFATAEPHVKKLRIYRLGGDSSEFRWLNDVDLEKILANGLPFKHSLGSATIFRPETNSLYPYIKVTDATAAALKIYVNSELDLKATPDTWNGKYRIVQIKQELSGTTPTGNTFILLETKEDHYTWSGSNITWNSPVTAPTVTTGSAITGTDVVIENFGYRDKKRTPVVSLHSLKDDNWPPIVFTANEDEELDVDTSTHFQYITSVGGIYFAAADSTIRFSRYGDPNNWPLDAAITLDSKINGIMEHNGEGIVFTRNSTYRVRGTDPKMMVAFRVPDGKGLTEAYRRTLAEYQGTIIWLSSDGLCTYNGGKVSNVLNNVHTFEPLANPSAAVINGVYWLVQESSDTEERYGYKINLASQGLRLTETTVTGAPGIQARNIFYSKNDGAGYVVTTPSTASAEIIGGKIGDVIAPSINWRSKELDLGEPNISKALVSLEVVYDVLDYDRSNTLVGGIRGEKLISDILNGTAFGGINDGVVEEADLQDILLRYDLSNLNYNIDAGSINSTFTDSQKKFLAMDTVASGSGGFDLSRVNAGDVIWGENLTEISKVVSTGSDTITDISGSSTTYYGINIDTEPQIQGECELWWGKLPILSVYINDSGTPEKQFVLPPKTSAAAPGETQTVDLYLDDLKKFRVFSIDVTGSVRIKSIGVRVEPMEAYQSQVLHHSADIFWRGTVDLRFILDGKTLMRKEMTAKNEFEEKRIYLPASSYGQRIHYLNESRMGMVNSVQFNNLNLTQNV